MIALVEGANAPEDAERDRADHAAGGDDADVPDRRAPPCPPSAASSARSVDSAAADRAAGVPDPDHDRRPAAGDRHRRHEPRAVGQRARQVGQGGRGGRRHRHAAARQDRHDHPRRPPATEFHPAGRRRSSAAARRRAARLARRPDAGRQVDRAAGARARAPSRTRGAATSDYVQFTAQTRMSGVDLVERPPRPQGRGRRRSQRVRRAGGAAPGRADRRASSRSRAAAPRRWWWPRAATCSA